MHATRQIDIARRLRIPRTTVSAAFHTDRLRPELKQRILDAAEKMGYRPHRYAQVMRSGKTGLIGIIRSSLPAATRLRLDVAASKAVGASGYEPLLKDADWIEHPEDLPRLMDGLLDAHVEGVLFLGISATLPASEIERVRNRRIPVVSINGIVLPGVAQVRNDACQGALALTRHVLSLGHRRPLLLTRWPATPSSAQWYDPNYNWAMAERIAGFQRAVAEAGGRVNDAEPLLTDLGIRQSHARSLRHSAHGGIEAEIIIESPEGQWNDLFHPGKEAMKKILQRPRRPSVVICHNDFWAVGALTACAEAGVRVPDDISLTGFDGLLISEYGSVPLTTAIQPVEAMANTAVKLLAELVRTGRRYKTGPHAKLPYEIVSRKSCARPS
jgi:DNA-binding LacI/PurR family transcriptional regulator